MDVQLAESKLTHPLSGNWLQREKESGRLYSWATILSAAAPTVIVAIFASLLLQSGLEFWFSDRARGMLENTVELAQSTYTSEVNRVGAEAVTMKEDFYKYLGPDPLRNPRFEELLGLQTYQRSLNESAIIR